MATDEDTNNHGGSKSQDKEEKELAERVLALLGNNLISAGASREDANGAGKEQQSKQSSTFSDSWATASQFGRQIDIGKENQPQLDQSSQVRAQALPARKQKLLLLKMLRSAEEHLERPPSAAQRQGSAVAWQPGGSAGPTAAGAECVFAVGSRARRLWIALGGHHAAQELLTDLCCPIIQVLAEGSGLIMPMQNTSAVTL